MAEQVAVLGAGAMGTALALSFDKAGSDVSLCGTEFDLQILDEIESSGRHPILDLPVPTSITPVRPEDWAATLATTGIVTIAVASGGVRDVVEAANPHISADAVWAIGSKGWDEQSAEPLSKVVASTSPGHPPVIVVGPSLAAELGGGVPTALVCASENVGAAEKVAAALSCETVRVFVTDDVISVEVGSAIKNVLAIAIGMCDGLSEEKGRSMSNTKAALFSRGLVEMSMLATAMGGRQETVLGLAGAGDLFVTVLGGRNGTFGRLVGMGLSPEKAFEEMGTTVEGYANTREARKLAKRHGLDLEVVEMVHSVLYEGTSPEEAVTGLVLGDVQREM